MGQIEHNESYAKLVNKARSINLMYRLKGQHSYLQTHPEYQSLLKMLKSEDPEMMDLAETIMSTSKTDLYEE